MITACGQSTAALTIVTGGTPGPIPHFDHIVVVIEENHSYSAIIGSSSAPYINKLAQQGADFTDSHGITHPSEPNYLALFAGTTFGLTSDDCPQSYSGPNLASVLTAQNATFTGYSESMPSAGFTDCSAGGNLLSSDYARKHNPWVNFATIPATSNQSFDSFPSDFTQLPSVAFVVPNQQHDMHSASIAAADTWLSNTLDSYVQWAATHNSLLVVTWDEDDNSTNNHIPTIFIGAHIKPGQYNETITHYTVLRTIEAIFGATPTNNALHTQPIADIWQ